MLKKPVLVPYYTSLSVFGAYVLVLTVLTIHVESGYNDAGDRAYRRNLFAFATGLHGLLVLCLIVLLYVQLLYFIPSRVQGYAHFSRRVAEWVQYQQYAYTAFSVIVMLLVVVSQQIPRNEQHQRRLDFFVFNDFFFLLIFVVLEYGTVAFLIVHSLRFIGGYVRKQPAADSLNYYQVLGIEQGQQVGDAEILKGQNDAINKMTQHLQQLNEQLQQLGEQLANCRTKQTSPEFERIRLELATAKDGHAEMRLRIRQMEGELQVVAGENEYLQGQIEGFRRSVRQGALDVARPE